MPLDHRAREVGDDDTRGLTLKRREVGLSHVDRRRDIVARDVLARVAQRFGILVERHD